MIYIRKAYSRMKRMQKSTWRFTSICFLTAYFYLLTAIFMLITNDISGNIVLIRNALEIASVSQAVILVCAIGSVIIEEAVLGKKQ